MKRLKRKKTWRDALMEFEKLRRCVEKKMWAEADYRPLCRALTKSAQEALLGFKPISFKSYQKNAIQLIDFFCGAGGMSLGFAALNSIVPAFNMLGGCDIDAVSAATYSHNFGTPFINRDIVELAHNPGKLQDLLQEIGYDKNKPTILIGCAPCQGFTSHRKRYWDEADDIRNNLINIFAIIAQTILPEAIIMENVPELLSNRYWKYFSAAKGTLKKSGYIVKECIYNAASFGVPQDRFRSIVICMKKNFVLPNGYLSEDKYRTVRDAIEDLPPVLAGVADPKDPMHRCAAHKQSTIDVIRQVPHNGGNRPAGVGPACLDRVNGFSDTYGRLYWDKPSITITHYARNPASGRYTHPEQDRGLTAREVALLQSFPYGFEFRGKSDDIYRQIGEAVPPMLAAGVAAAILIELFSTEPSAEELENSPKSIDSPVNSSYSSVIAGIKTRRKVDTSGFTCIDSFCGAGGLALGLKRAGFNLLYSFDIDPKCIETISSNRQYFDHPAEVADIADMLNGNLLRKCGLERGELFLLAGGPPCQGFSVQRRGDDNDIRNDLVLRYGQLIDEVYPKYFIMENVSGLGGKRGKTILEELLERLNALGYSVHIRLLDAQEYGVPQRRRRYVIVGERGDMGNYYKYPRPISVRHTVRETIGMLPPPPEDGSDHPDFPLHRRDRLSETNLRRLAALSEGQGRDNLPKELLANCHRVDSTVIGYRNVYGRMSWDDVAPTITAKFDSFTRGKFGHPDQMRSISLREGALLQTFPIDFIFIGNKIDIARQIGNAVPPVMAERIGKSILDCYRKAGD